MLQGSVSVSMSIYQTLFCFICTHLSAGEKPGDELKRNADVHDILRRTLFHSYSTFGLPRGIHDHEWVLLLPSTFTVNQWLLGYTLTLYKCFVFFSCRRIIWLGDLNYRINLSYDETCDLISKKEWSELRERDQVVYWCFLIKIWDLKPYLNLVIYDDSLPKSCRKVEHSRDGPRGYWILHQHTNTR